MHHRSLTLVLVLGSSLGCQPSGPTNSPNVVEQAASDIEHEADQADETVEQAGDDVEGAGEDVADAIDG